MTGQVRLAEWLRRWATNIRQYGGDMHRWSDPMFVAQTMDRLADESERAPEHRIECASCHKRPEGDVVLVRKNVKGVHGVFLCQWCDLSDASETAAAVRARELQIAQQAEDTGINELIRFAQILRGDATGAAPTTSSP